MPKFRIRLNLLHPQGLAEKLPVRFLRWVLSYGRFIVVFVEILVLATFASRFKLDQDLANLKDEINRQVPYIESLSVTESLIKQTQFRLLNFRSIRAESQDLPSVLGKIAAQVPEGVTFKNISLSRPQESLPHQFKVSGAAQSNSALSAFLYYLKNDASFKNVRLSNIGFEEGAVNFTLTGDIK